MNPKTLSSLEEAAADLFQSEIRSAISVPGGDINRPFRLEIDGRSVFVKTNRSQNLFFEAEAEGLAAVPGPLPSMCRKYLPKVKTADMDYYALIMRTEEICIISVTCRTT